MRLTVAERELLRKRVNEFILKNPTLKKYEIVNHYVKEGIAKRTMYNTLKRLEQGKPLKDLPRSGRPCKLNRSNLNKLKRAANNKIGVTSKDMANKNLEFIELQ